MTILTHALHMCMQAHTCELPTMQKPATAKGALKWKWTESQSRASCSVENLTPCPKSCMMGAWREEVRGGPYISSVCMCVGGGATGTCDIQIILVKPFKSSTPGGAGVGHTPWLASVR